MNKINPILFYKSLADDTRLKCLLLLQRYGELCVCDLTQGLQLSQPKVSRHLAQLRDAQIISGDKRGKWVYYQLHPQLPQWCNNVLLQTLQHNADFLSDCKIQPTKLC